VALYNALIAVKGALRAVSLDISLKPVAKMLGLFGESDVNPSPAHVALLENELKKHNKVYEFKSYTPDVGHGFFADYRPSYRQEAAVDGWRRIFNFFGRYLG
jgi:carboxymethylenebutenolidase